MSTHADSRHRCTVADLLLAARRGDRSAWEQLIDRYSRLIRSVAAEFRLQESDAADVAQNTWLRLFAHAATIRDPEKLAGWLATTARREALTLIRKSRPEVATESAGEDIATPEPSPEDVVVLAETRAAVRRAAAELTGRQRLLVDELFYQPPRSYDEVSRRTGLPVGSIARPGSGRSGDSTVHCKTRSTWRLARRDPDRGQVAATHSCTFCGFAASHSFATAVASFLSTSTLLSMPSMSGTGISNFCSIA